MANSFKESADYLASADDQTQGSDYVVCYLLRYVIELPLKPMILILHRSQNIPFPDHTRGGYPKIHSGNPLLGTHSLAVLYDHFHKAIGDSWD